MVNNKKNIMKTLFLTITLMILLQVSSCDKERNDDKLSLPRQNYYGNELKIDGFYYMYSSDYKLMQIKFLYSNGIEYVLGSGFSSIEEIEKILDEGRYKKNSKVSWGIFIISNNEIQSEHWGEPLGLGSGLRTKLDYGLILNDTTYVVYKMTTSDGREKVKNDTFHFYQYSPKPDSINPYIK